MSRKFGQSVSPFDADGAIAVIENRYNYVWTSEAPRVCEDRMYSFLSSLAQGPLPLLLLECCASISPPHTHSPTHPFSHRHTHPSTRSVRELLTFYEFPGDEIAIVKGSALAAATGGDAKLGKNAILELMEAVEKSIPTPKRETEKPFLMPVEDTFSISGRGTVVTGRIEQGVLKVGDDIEIVGLAATQKSTCTGTFFSYLSLSLSLSLYPIPSYFCPRQTCKET